MSDLKPADRAYLEKLLEMSGGYVLSFSNSSFADFVRASTGEDIYDAKYSGNGGSKANRLRAFWQLAPNGQVAALLGDLLAMLVDDGKAQADGDAASRVRRIIVDLRGGLRENRSTTPRSPKELTGTGRAFISYSVQQKQEGAKVKSCLADLGYESFLAHDDLRVSEEWRQRILEELRVVDVFVALLSAEFKRSDWCGQELGFIVSRSDVLIVPLALDRTIPYGFIAQLNDRSVDDGNVAAVLADVMFEHRPRNVIPAQIRRIASASSYRGAEALVRPLVPHYAKFSSGEVEMFAQAVAGNSEVWDAGLCAAEYIPRFVETNRARLSPQSAGLLKQVLPDLDLQPGERAW